MTEDSFYSITISMGSVALSSPGGADAELTLSTLWHTKDVLAAKGKKRETIRDEVQRREITRLQK